MKWINVLRILIVIVWVGIYLLITGCKTTYVRIQTDPETGVVVETRVESGRRFAAGDGENRIVVGKVSDEFAEVLKVIVPVVEQQK